MQFDIDFKNIDIRPEENTSTILCSSWEYETEPFDVSLFLNNFTLTIFEIQMFRLKVGLERLKLITKIFSKQSQNDGI